MKEKVILIRELFVQVRSNYDLLPKFMKKGKYFSMIHWKISSLI